MTSRGMEFTPGVTTMTFTLTCLYEGDITDVKRVALFDEFDSELRLFLSDANGSFRYDFGPNGWGGLGHPIFTVKILNAGADDPDPVTQTTPLSYEFAVTVDRVAACSTRDAIIDYFSSPTGPFITMFASWSDAKNLHPSALHTIRDVEIVCDGSQIAGVFGENLPEPQIDAKFAHEYDVLEPGPWLVSSGLHPKRLHRIIRRFRESGKPLKPGLYGDRWALVPVSDACVEEHCALAAESYDHAGRPGWLHLVFRQPYNANHPKFGEVQEAWPWEPTHVRALLAAEGAHEQMPMPTDNDELAAWAHSAERFDEPFAP